MATERMKGLPPLLRLPQEIHDNIALRLAECSAEDLAFNPKRWNGSLRAGNLNCSLRSLRLTCKSLNQAYVATNLIHVSIEAGPRAFVDRLRKFTEHTDVHHHVKSLKVAITSPTTRAGGQSDSRHVKEWHRRKDFHKSILGEIIGAVQAVLHNRNGRSLALEVDLRFLHPDCIWEMSNRGLHQTYGELRLTSLTIHWPFRNSLPHGFLAICSQRTMQHLTLIESTHLLYQYRTLLDFTCDSKMMLRQLKSFIFCGVGGTKISIQGLQRIFPNLERLGLHGQFTISKNNDANYGVSAYLFDWPKLRFLEFEIHPDSEAKVCGAFLSEEDLNDIDPNPQIGLEIPADAGFGPIASFPWDWLYGINDRQICLNQYLDNKHRNIYVIDRKRPPRSNPISLFIYLDPFNGEYPSIYPKFRHQLERTTLTSVDLGIRRTWVITPVSSSSSPVSREAAAAAGDSGTGSGSGIGSDLIRRRPPPLLPPTTRREEASTTTTTIIRVDQHCQPARCCPYLCADVHPQHAAFAHEGLFNNWRETLADDHHHREGRKRDRIARRLALVEEAVLANVDRKRGTKRVRTVERKVKRWKRRVEGGSLNMKTKMRRLLVEEGKSKKKRKKKNDRNKKEGGESWGGRRRSISSSRTIEVEYPREKEVGSFWCEKRGEEGGEPLVVVPQNKEEKKKKKGLKRWFNKWRKGKGERGRYQGSLAIRPWEYSRYQDGCVYFV